MGFLGGDELFSFDVTVPNSTLVNGALGTTFDGYAFSPTNVLYALEQGGQRLHTINPATGTATLVGNTGIATVYGTGGLAFDATGNLYGVVGGGGGGGPSFLYQINPTTAAATLIGAVGFDDVSGLAMQPAAPSGPGVVITQSGGSTSVVEGGATDTYTAVLNTAPTANVTLTFNPGTQATASSATLIFTPANWNTPQTVTVSAVDDALVEGPHTATITRNAASTDAAYNAIAIASVTVSITDNDGAPPTAGPGGPEGTYPGSTGPPGPEGSFGFGGRSLPPILVGPVPQPPTHAQVFNASHRQLLQANKASGKNR
jgi:hypothetical protein